MPPAKSVSSPLTGSNAKNGITRCQTRREAGKADGNLRPEPRCSNASASVSEAHNVFFDRAWRSIPCEEGYRRAHETVGDVEARATTVLAGQAATYGLVRATAGRAFQMPANASRRGVAGSQGLSPNLSCW